MGKESKRALFETQCSQVSYSCFSANRLCVLCTKSVVNKDEYIKKLTDCALAKNGQTEGVQCVRRTPSRRAA